LKIARQFIAGAHGMESGPGAHGMEIGNMPFVPDPAMNGRAIAGRPYGTVANF